MGYVSAVIQHGPYLEGACRVSLDTKGEGRPRSRIVVASKRKYCVNNPEVSTSSNGSCVHSIDSIPSKLHLVRQSIRLFLLFINVWFLLLGLGYRAQSH